LSHFFFYTLDKFYMYLDKRIFTCILSNPLVILSALAHIILLDMGAVF